MEVNRSNEFKSEVRLLRRVAFNPEVGLLTIEKPIKNQSMPIIIYDNGRIDLRTIDQCSPDEWELPSQIHELEQWLKANHDKIPPRKIRRRYWLPNSSRSHWWWQRHLHHNDSIASQNGHGNLFIRIWPRFHQRDISCIT
jgi:hypothetical protein